MSTRISADRPIAPWGPPSATEKTSETESVQKPDMSESVPLEAAPEQVAKEPAATNDTSAQHESRLGGLARQAELQSQFPSAPELKKLPDLHPNIDPNVHLNEKIDLTKNLPEGKEINKGLAGLEWGPNKAKTGPSQFVDMTYGGMMKPPKDVLAEVKPGQATSGWNAPGFRTGGGFTTVGSGGGDSSKGFNDGHGGKEPKGPTTLGGRDMSLVGNSNKTIQMNEDGSTIVTTTRKGVETSKTLDPNGKLVRVVETTIDKNGVKTQKGFDANGDSQGKMVTTKDGQVTLYGSDGKEVKFDKDEKKKYDTGEGEDLMKAPSAEEFLKIKNFGGGYTDGRPELQNNITMQKDPVEADPNFGVIDANPDYIESTIKPNVGNHAQPETTRSDLQAPAPEAPPKGGYDPKSNPS